MKKEFVDREEIYNLIKKGYTVEMICNYYRETKGININYPSMNKLVKEIHAEKNDLETYAANKPSTKEMLKLKEAGYTYKEISKKLEAEGKKITSQGVYLRIKRFYDLRGEQPLKGEKLGLEKVELLNSDDKVELDNILREEIIFKGTTIANWCKITECEYLQKSLSNRLEKMKIIASNAKKVNGKLVPDQEFLNILKIVGDNKLEEPYKKYNVYLKQYTDNYNYLKNGSIDTLKRQAFKNNADLMVYILEGYQPKFKKEEYTQNEQYDEKVYNKAKRNFKEKTLSYFKRLEMIESRAELAEIIKRNTENITEDDKER